MARSTRKGSDTHTSRLVDDSGETAVGSTILFGIVLLGLFMVIQLLLAYYVRSVASAAATDAAIITAWDGSTEADGESYARRFILEQAGGLVDAGDLTVDADRGDEFVVVQVRGRTNLMRGIVLDVTASAPVERFESQEN